MEKTIKACAVCNESVEVNAPRSNKMRIIGSAKQISPIKEASDLVQEISNALFICAPASC